MEDIKAWVIENQTDDHYGCGKGSGKGSGKRCYSGYGCGRGCGEGCRGGSGFGCGFDEEDSSGYGFGFAVGGGYDCGFGYGVNNGDGLKEINGQKIFMIDSIPTILTHVKGSVAKGSILLSDLTLQPCFVVKGQGYFAHGETLRKAQEALQEKILEDLDTESSIQAFLQHFQHGKRYRGTEFFTWHHCLTGSCLMGRESFVKERNLDLKATYTVEEFIAICEDAYGSDVIKELKQRWNDQIH